MCLFSAGLFPSFLVSALPFLSSFSLWAVPLTILQGSLWAWTLVIEGAVLGNKYADLCNSAESFIALSALASSLAFLLGIMIDSGWRVGFASPRGNSSYFLVLLWERFSGFTADQSHSQCLYFPA